MTTKRTQNTNKNNTTKTRHIKQWNENKHGRIKHHETEQIGKCKGDIHTKTKSKKTRAKAKQEQNKRTIPKHEAIMW